MTRQGGGALRPERLHGKQNRRYEYIYTHKPCYIIMDYINLIFGVQYSQDPVLLVGSTWAHIGSTADTTGSLISAN